MRVASVRVVAGILALAVISLAASTKAQEPGGGGTAPIVSGQLLALDGTTPLPGREIRVLDATTGVPLAVTSTGPDGSFSLPPLPPGDYYVETTSLSQLVQVREGQRLQHLKLLIPAPPAVQAARPPSVEEPEPEGEDLESILLWTGAGTAVIIGGSVGSIVGYQLSGSRRRRRTPATAPSPLLLLETSPDGDFGRVERGRSREVTFVVRSLSPLEALLVHAHVDGASAFEVLSAASFTVPPGGNRVVVVRFAPTVLGSHLGALRVEALGASGAGLHHLSRSLQGEGVAPPSVSPSAP